MIYIGIDPGLSGAVAIIADGQDPKVFDMQTILKGGTGSVKYEVDAASLYSSLIGYAQFSGIIACLERVNSMPGQAASSTFSLGDSFGVARACLACAGIPTVYVTPQVWKKHFKLTSNKEESRSLAAKLYPSVDLSLKKYVDRAEALLIATYLKETRK